MVSQACYIHVCWLGYGVRELQVIPLIFTLYIKYVMNVLPQFIIRNVFVGYL